MRRMILKDVIAKFSTIWGKICLSYFKDNTSQHISQERWWSVVSSELQTFEPKMTVIDTFVRILKKSACQENCHTISHFRYFLGGARYKMSVKKPRPVNTPLHFKYKSPVRISERSRDNSFRIQPTGSFIILSLLV